jgi:hypothetical protein
VKSLPNLGKPLAEEKMVFHAGIVVSVAVMGFLCAWLAVWFVILPAIRGLEAGTDPWEGASPLTRSIGALVALYAAIWCTLFLVYKGRAKIFGEGLILPWGIPGRRFYKYEDLQDLTLFIGASGRWALGLKLPNRGSRIMIIRPKTTMIANFLLKHAEEAFSALSGSGIPKKPYPGSGTY